MVRFAVARKMSSSRPSSSAIVRGFTEQGDAGLRVLAPGSRDPQRADRVTLLAACRRADDPGDLDRLATQPLRLAEHPLEHPDLGERGKHERPLPGRLGRDELEGPPVGHDRAVLVAGGPAVAPEPLVQEREGDPVGALVESGDRRLGEGRRPGRSPVGERRLGRPGEEPRRCGRVGSASAGDRSVVQLQGQLEVGQRVARRVDRLRQPAASIAAARAGPGSWARRWWRAREPGRSASPRRGRSDGVGAGRGAGRPRPPGR